ncbi:site-specific integrase [Ancylobacter sp. 6x-1]|uniref:Site-specific integrase n=1 Tax=Ancylobacter crimeensis TaxID=2579147 RepID=A0ABT0DF35_9HYPH|nr:site-specific integrase [Ancylobacter crimeensis]MCK0198558.1 site-specific integrase [Ancylobacter crimeensis]
MASKTRNLQFKDGRYYARLSIHKALQPILGRKEFVAPLGADRTAALDRLPAAIAGMKEEIAIAKRQLGTQQKPTYRPKPSPRRQLEPVEIAAPFLQSRLKLDDEVRNSGHPLAGLGYPDHDHIDQLRQIVAGKRPAILPASLAFALDHARATGNLKNEGATLRLLAQAELVAIDTEMSRDEGEPDPPIPANLIAQPAQPAPDKATSARILSADSTKTLSELVPRLIRERQPSPATAREYEVMARQFEELVDPVPAVYEITRRHVQRFKDRLLETPSSATKRFKDMTLPEAIEANKKRAQPYDCLDPKTINDKTLMRLTGLLNWAMRQDIIPDNPATGVRAEITGGKVKAPPRVHFNPGDLTKLFAPRLFAPTGRLGETQWAMLIGLFAGLRPSESAQMRLDSVIHQRGVLCLTVEEETKTEGSRRIVPVHSTLIALGFEQYVERLRQTKETHLFPKWYEDGMTAKAEATAKSKTVLNHYFPRFIPRRFNVTYKKNAGIADPRKDFYSFRHTFKTGLSMAGVERGVMDQLCGHSDNTAGAVYVHGVSVEALKEAVERLHYDGLDLKSFM